VFEGGENDLKLPNISNRTQWRVFY
jgi:hypothetical protein